MSAHHFEVTAPDAAAAPPGLGRIGAVLARIAGAQGLTSGADADLHHVARVTVAGPSDVSAGVAVVDRLVDSGTRLLVVEGADTAAAFVVLAALLDLEPVAAVGTAPSAGWSQQLVAVRDGLARTRAYVGDPERLLEVAGEPGVLAGALAQAAVRRTPVLLDGSAQVAAALLIADRIAPGVAAWCTATTTPATPGAVAALHDLGVEPLLDLGLTSRGAALALSLLREAVTPDPVRA